MCLFRNPECLLSNETSFTQKFNLVQKRWVKDHKHLILSISKLFCLWANSKPDSTHFWNQINYTNKVCFRNIVAWMVYNELRWSKGMERSWVSSTEKVFFFFLFPKKIFFTKLESNLCIPSYFNPVNLLITMAHLEIKVLKFSSIQETRKTYPFNWKRKKYIYIFFINFLDFYFYFFNFRISKITKRSHFGELKGNLPNGVDRRTTLNTN